MFTIDSWVHACGVYESGGDLILYADGTELNRVTPTGSYSDIADNFHIGAYSTDSTTFWGGLIDGVKIYDYARTPAQIAWDYNRGRPLAHWQIDECSDTTINDNSGNSYTGTITIGTSGTNTSTGSCSGSSGEAWADGSSGKVNASLEFDGTDDLISMGNTATIEGNSEASVCLWIKYGPGSVTADSALVGRYLGAGNGWTLWIDDEAAYSLRTDTISFAPAPGGGTGGRVEGSTGLVSSGVWDHYCATFQGGSFIRLYKNGLLDQEETSSVTSSVSSDNANLYIGRIDNASPRWFQGQIDDVKIFNYALNDTQILNLYNNGAVSFGN